MKVRWPMLSRWKAWWSQRQLERELKQSYKFQKRCERMQCFTLAALEKNYREQLVKKAKGDLR